MNNDSIQKTLKVSILLCLVCSIVVSSAAVFLRPTQKLNKEIDKKKIILEISGLLPADQPITNELVQETFKKIESQVINLAEGTVDPDKDPKTFNAKKALQDPTQTHIIPKEKDIGKLKRRALWSTIYLYKEDEQIKKIILPVSGLGLWSTLYGLLVLAPDTKTIEGLAFYQHGETPGLGGEVDNPLWKALWKGKKALNDDFEPIIELVKGKVTTETVDHESKVDALSGATITSVGVTNLLQYWLSDDGYGPYLANLRNQAN